MTVSFAMAWYAIWIRIRIRIRFVFHKCNVLNIMSLMQITKMNTLQQHCRSFNNCCYNASDTVEKEAISAKCKVTKFSFIHTNQMFRHSLTQSISLNWKARGKKKIHFFIFRWFIVYLQRRCERHWSNALQSFGKKIFFFSFHSFVFIRCRCFLLTA